MKFDNSQVRRQDRLLDEPQARELLAAGEYGVLSMVSPEGRAYGVPISYVWDGGEYIYLHAAPEGEKLRALDGCAEVSFCVVGRTHVVPDRFTTEYESIVLRCRARRGLPPEERMHALELLLAKYSPDDAAVGRKYAAGSFGRTEIVRLTVETMSGKCKRLNVNK